MFVGKLQEGFAADRSKVVPLLQSFSVFASVTSYEAFVVSVLALHLSFH